MQPGRVHVSQQINGTGYPAALKSKYLHGAAWDLAAEPLLETVDELSHTEGVAQASLHGDRAHVILDSTQWSPDSLTKYLAGKSIIVNSIETVQSTLEDVFTLLAHRGKMGETAVTKKSEKLLLALFCSTSTLSHIPSRRAADSPPPWTPLPQRYKLSIGVL